MSILLAALDPRAKDPFERTRQQEAVTVPALVESFAEVVLPETTALLAALAQLAPDELSRGQGAAGGRGQPARGAGVACPAWRDFGIAGSTVSQRGYQVIQAAGLQLADDTSVIRPDSPDLLVSERRRQIVNRRNQYSAATEG